MKKGIIKIILFIVLFICLVQVAVVRNSHFIRNEDKTIAAISKQSYSAKSVIAMDLDSKKILYEQNINQPCLPASITKLMTLYVCVKYYNLDDYIITTDAMTRVDGSRIYLVKDDCYTVRDLLYGMMLVSGNDAALALALHYSGDLNDFIYLMNKEAKDIGMNNSTFKNPNGLDEQTQNYTTAYDMALLMSAGCKYQSFYQIINTKKYTGATSVGPFSFINKHRLIYRDSRFIGGKTGYTKLAGRTLVSCFSDNNKRIVVVTMDAYGDWDIHINLANYFLKTPI